MRVLLIGKHNMLFWLEHTHEAFAATGGVEVCTLEVNHLGFGRDLLRNVVKPFSKRAAYGVARNAMAAEIAAFSPDMIFVISPFLLDDTLIEALDAAPEGVIKAGWIGDRFGERHRLAAGRFDRLYGTDSSFIDHAEALGFPAMRYLPLAANERLFCDRGLPRREELLFIGAPTPGRIETINAVHSVGMRVVGRGWKAQMEPEVACDDRNIGIEAVAEAYNRSAFVLNVKHEHNVVNGLNMRSFEAPACGACLVQDYVKDVDRNFDPEEEIVVYASLEELDEKLAALRKDQTRYDKIRQNGYRRVMAEHTYRHRIAAILADLK